MVSKKSKKSEKNMLVARQKVLQLLISFIVILLLGFLIKDFVLAKPRDVRVSNVTSTSATVSWVTSSKSPGIVVVSERDDFTNTPVDLFTFSRHFDSRDINVTSRKTSINPKKRFTHYVTINGLEEGKEYHFRISNGLNVWNSNSIADGTKWYSIDNIKSLDFTTATSSESAIVMPQTFYGNIEDHGLEGYNDAILLAQLYENNADGSINTSVSPSIVSTYVNQKGGWVLDYSDILLSDTTKTYSLYLYAQIENKRDIPGQFELVKTGDSYVDLFKYDRLQSLEKSFLRSIYSPDKVNAAGRDLCCAMIITGRKNVYYDFEDNASCDSCGQCFPVGKQLLGGEITGVVEVDAKDQNSCESIKRLASEGLPEDTTPGGGSSSGNFGGTCNAFLNDSDFEVSNINRSQLISYANRLAGEGSKAEECFNYVVCKAKQYGINPAMMLNIWVHESAASNYKRFPGVEDMGIHCYGGAGDYPAYSCNTTPKENIKAQTEMFALLPHTKCLEGGFDIVKWATGFWTGKCDDTSFGQRFYTDLQLQWSSYGKGAFPNWIKNSATAQPNLKCDTDGASTPPTSGGTSSNGSSSGSTGSNGSTQQPSGTPTTSTYVNPTNDMCCAVIVEGSDKFLTKKSVGKTCSSAFPVGSNFESQKGSGKVEFGVEIEAEIEKTVEPLCCAIQYEGRSNLYFDYENKQTCNKCGECFPVGSTNGGSKVLAVGSEPLKGSNDAEWRANCESTVRPASAGVPQDREAKVVYDLKCDHREFGIECKNWAPTPATRKVVDSYGENIRCINPNVTPKDDGVISIPISKSGDKVFSYFLNTVAAADANIKKVEGNTVQFKEDGIYDIQIGNLKVSNVSINSDAKYRFYENNNNIKGYQKDSDKEVSPADLKAVKVESGFRLELNSGHNFVSLNYKRDPNAIVVTPDNPSDITSHMILSIANVDETRLTYLTTFESGKWKSGIRVANDNIGKIYGNSFIIKPTQGYFITSNTDLKGAMAIVLPGKRVNDKVQTQLVKGWAFVGLTGEILPNTSVKYIQESASINSIERLILTRWEDKKGLFENVQSIGNEAYGNNFTLNNSSGYFIYTDKAFTLK